MLYGSSNVMARNEIFPSKMKLHENDSISYISTYYDEVKGMLSCEQAILRRLEAEAVYARCSSSICWNDESWKWRYAANNTIKWRNSRHARISQYKYFIWRKGNQIERGKLLSKYRRSIMKTEGDETHAYHSWIMIWKFINNKEKGERQIFA